MTKALSILRRETEQSSTVVEQFRTSPELICGIELDAQSMRITWSLDSYLDSLEEDLSKMLERRAAEELEVREEG